MAAIAGAGCALTGDASSMTQAISILSDMLNSANDRLVREWKESVAKEVRF